jgi:hypothetical protein
MDPSIEEKEAIESQDTADSAGIDRRTFLRAGAAVGAAALSLPALLDTASAAQGQALSQGDVDVLRFLAAAELIEEDLWRQYTEFAEGNEGYREVLESLDEGLPQYISDTTDDERSHADFINAFLRSRHAQPVNLDRFRTLPAVDAEGADQSTMRLTNLRSLNVDTSWFMRYRGAGNPDFGDTFPQIANIRNRAAVPTSDGLSDDQLKAAAYTAAFHFPTVEQGGTSLYVNMLGKVRRIETLRIVASIGPVEAIHFSVFQGSLEDMEEFDAGGGLIFPDLENMEELAEAVMPKPCTFLQRDLPRCSVIRPTSEAKAGAVAATNAMIASNLFLGQSPTFLRELRTLAERADRASRGF